MLELRHRNEEAWDPDLRPLVDHDGDDAEVFDDWWARTRDRLGHLGPEIAGQWMHRHWRSTRYRFLDLNGLRWRREVWSTEAYLGGVHLEFGGPVDPDHDYAAFSGEQGRDALPTAKGWRDGTWDIAPIILETPFGIRSYDGERPNGRYLVIEGAKRYRYLNALAHRGEPAGPHAVYILSSPQVVAEG